MKIGLYIIISLLIGFIYSIVDKESKNPPKSEIGDYTTIKLPRSYYLTGILCMLFFLGLLVILNIFYFGVIEKWLEITLISLITIGVLFVLAYKIWNIYIFDEHFIYRATNGKEYKLNYSDIEYVNLGDNRMLI